MSEQVSFIDTKMKRRRAIPPACLVMTAAHDECNGNARPGGRCLLSRARTPRYGLGALPLLLSILTIHRHIITCQVVLGFSPLAATLRRGRANTRSNMRAAPVTVTLMAKKKKSTAATTKVIEIEQDDEEEALYWRVDTDEFAFTDDVDENGERSSDTTSSTKKLLKFTVRGKPVPLRRHRTSRGFMYNPSAKMQMEFRQVVSDMIYPTVPPSSVEEYIESSSAQQPEPIFKEDEYLAVTLLFRLKRPKSHFIGSKPGPGRLRPTSPGKLHTTRTDVDNLAKFVLDSLNDLVYVDDRQIISLHAAKVLDSEGHCEGATEVIIRRLHECEMESFVSNMGDI